MATTYLEDICARWGARRRDESQLGQIKLFSRSAPRIHHSSQVACTGSKNRHANILRVLPQRTWRRVQWVPIENDDRRTGTQGAHEPIPHHPATVKIRVLEHEKHLRHPVYLPACELTQSLCSRTLYLCERCSSESCALSSGSRAHQDPGSNTLAVPWCHCCT